MIKRFIFGWLILNLLACEATPCATRKTIGRPQRIEFEKDCVTVEMALGQDNKESVWMGFKSNNETKEMLSLLSKAQLDRKVMLVETNFMDGYSCGVREIITSVRPLE